MNRSLWIAALACAVAATSAPARADVVSTLYQFRGNEASASFQWWNDCGMGNATIVGGDDVSHDAHGAPIESAVAYAWFDSMNWCTSSYVAGWGVVDSASIRRLEGATLSVPLALSGQTCAPSPADPMSWSCDAIAPGTQATFNATLSAVGPTSTGTTMTHTASGAYRTTSRATGSSRAASATASLFYGGRDLLAGVQATNAQLAYNATSAHWFYRF